MTVKMRLVESWLGRGYRVRVSIPKGRKPTEAAATLEVVLPLSYECAQWAADCWRRVYP